MIILPGTYNMSKMPHYRPKDMVEGLCNTRVCDVTKEWWTRTRIDGIHGVNNPGRREVCRRCLGAPWCSLSPTCSGILEHSLIKSKPLTVFTMLYRQGSSPKPLWPFPVKLAWNQGVCLGRGERAGCVSVAASHGSLSGGTETRHRKVIEKREWPPVKGLTKQGRPVYVLQAKYLLFPGMLFLSCLYDMPRASPGLLMQPVPRRRGMEGSEWQKDIPILKARQGH